MISGGDNGYAGDGNGSQVYTNSINISNINGSSLVGKNIKKVSLGLHFALALDSSGNVHFWGSNIWTEIGLTTYGSPTLVGGRISLPYIINGIDNVLSNSSVLDIVAATSYTNLYFITAPSS